MEDYEVTSCKKCGCRDLNKKNIIEWDTAYCPICGADLKDQLEEDKAESEV